MEGAELLEVHESEINWSSYSYAFVPRCVCLHHDPARNMLPTACAQACVFVPGPVQ